MKTKRIWQVGTILMLILSTTSVFPQAAFWQPTGGPTGGIVEIITLHPNGTILAARQGSGVFRSSNSGGTWNSSSLGLNPDILTLSVAPDGCIFAGTHFDGLFVSCDGGATWNKIESGSEMDEASIRSIAFNTSHDIFAGGTGRLFRSDDSAITWTRIFNGFTNRRINSISALSNDTVFVATDGDGIFRSADGGDSWERPNTGLTDSTVNDLTFNAEGELLAATHGGLFFSNNQGDSWQAAMDTALQNIALSRVVATPTGQVFVLAAQAGFLSEDNGTTWAPLQGQPFSRGPRDLAAGHGELFIGTEHGAFRSVNNGFSWNEINSGLVITSISCVAANEQGILFATASPRGIYKSTDNGDSWSQIDTSISIEHPTHLVMLPEGDLFVGTAGSGDVGNGIFRSQDGGTTWAHLSTLGPFNGEGFVDMLGVSPDGALFTHLLFTGIHRSLDAGETWEQIEDAPVLRSFGSNLNGYLFGGASAGIFRSNDGGNSWENVHSQFAWSFSASGTEAVLAATSSGVLRSSDNGATWENIGLEQEQLFQVFLGPSNEIFTASDRDVFVLPENGPSWLLLNEGLTSTSVKGFASSDHLIFAATGAGVFRGLSQITSVDSDPATLPQVFSLEQNHPNPFNPETEIRFRLPETTFIELRIFNTLGQEIRTLASGNFQAGFHQVRWDSKDNDGNPVASGIYLYELTSNNFRQVNKMSLVR